MILLYISPELLKRRALILKRRHNLRCLVLLMIFCFEMEQFINVGEGNQYLYLRRRLEWGYDDYTYFSMIVSIVGVTAQYITIPLFSSIFKFRDSTIILIDISGCFIQAIILIFASKTWIVYLGAFIAFLDSTSYSMIRCMISKHVKPDEVGKILAFVGAFQAFIPIISSPVFGSIYRATVDKMPQAYLILLASLFFIDWCVLVYIDRGVRRVGRKMAIEMKDLKEEEGGDGGKEVLDDLLKKEGIEHKINEIEVEPPPYSKEDSGESTKL